MNTIWTGFESRSGHNSECLTFNILIMRTLNVIGFFVLLVFMGVGFMVVADMIRPYDQDPIRKPVSEAYTVSPINGWDSGASLEATLKYDNFLETIWNTDYQDSILSLDFQYAKDYIAWYIERGGDSLVITSKLLDTVKKNSLSRYADAL